VCSSDLFDGPQCFPFWSDYDVFAGVKRYRIEQSPAPKPKFGPVIKNIIGRGPDISSDLSLNIIYRNGKTRVVQSTDFVSWSIQNTDGDVVEYQIEISDQKASAQSPAPEIEDSQEWGDWEGFNGQDVMVDGDFECQVVTAEEGILTGWASAYRWDNGAIKAFCTRIEPEVEWEDNIGAMPPKLVGKRVELEFFNGNTEIAQSASDWRWYLIESETDIRRFREVKS